MARVFKIPEPWNSRGWKLKIRDKERNEDPHVTLFFRDRIWRFGLRELGFLDDEPPARDVPSELVRHIKARASEYVLAWDELYPENPVDSRGV